MPYRRFPAAIPIDKAQAATPAALQKALLDRAQWLNLAAQESQMGLWCWEEGRTFGFWDARSYEIFGVSPRVKNKLETFYRVLHPDDRERVTETWRYQREKRKPTDLEYRVARPDGSVRWVHSLGHTYDDKTRKVVRVVGVNFDITDRKNADQERLQLSGRLINAQEEERARIARELHDDFSQRIAIVALRLEKITKSVENPDASKQLCELRMFVDNIGGDLHSLSHRLHASSLEILGLAQNVGPLCTGLAKEYGIQVDFDCVGLPQSISPEVTLCLFRIVQEGLRNVVKHSHASKVEVRLRGNLEMVSLTLLDNGVGFDFGDRHASNGIGIQSMKERARILGGTLEVRSERLRGTQITVVVPLKRTHPAILPMM